MIEPEHNYSLLSKLESCLTFALSRDTNFNVINSQDFKNDCFAAIVKFGTLIRIQALNLGLKEYLFAMNYMQVQNK